MYVRVGTNGAHSARASVAGTLTFVLYFSFPFFPSTLVHHAGPLQIGDTLELVWWLEGVGTINYDILNNLNGGQRLTAVLMKAALGSLTNPSPGMQLTTITNSISTLTTRINTINSSLIGSSTKNRRQVEKRMEGWAQP
jgi:hypothetical protein